MESLIMKVYFSLLLSFLFINFDVLLLVAKYLGLFCLSGEKWNIFFLFFFHYVLSLIILLALESTLTNSHASLLMFTFGMPYLSLSNDVVYIYI